MRFCRLALPLVLALGSATAFAASTASASLSNLKLWVFDLDPLDALLLGGLFCVGLTMRRRP